MFSDEKKTNKRFPRRKNYTWKPDFPPLHLQMNKWSPIIIHDELHMLAQPYNGSHYFYQE